MGYGKKPKYIPYYLFLIGLLINYAPKSYAEINLDKNTLKELNKITRTLPSLFESLKFMVGSHYMTFPVVYDYKNKRVRTMCYILLDWMSSPKRILTKSIILNGENN